MSLLVWIPMVHGDCKDQGLLGVETSVINTVTYVDGKLGKAAQIGNGNQVTNGIQINTNLVEELGTQYSCSVWIKPLGNHVHYEGAIISSGDWNNKCWAFGVNQNNTAVDVFCGGYNRNVTCSVPVNEWTHLVSVNDGTHTHLYKNGELISTATTSSWPLSSDATITTVGRESYANGYFSFNGCIQDLRIYNHALSPLEVKHLAQGLVLHYPLNRGGFGQENLATQYVVSGSKNPTNTGSAGRTVYIGDYSIQIPATENADTYFSIYYSKPLEVNKVYTLSAYVSGLIDNSYYSFPLFAQNNYAMGVIRFDHNGLCKLTFTMTYTGTIPTAMVNGNTVYRMFMDDNGRTIASGQGPITISHIKLEEGSTATPWTPAPSDDLFSQMGLDNNIEYDVSGYGNNGIRVGTFSWSGDTPRYNASTYVKSSSSINHPRCLSNDDQEWTCCAWVKLDSSTSYQKLNNFNNGNIVVYDTTPILYLNNGSDDYYMYGSQIIPVDEWTHIAFVFKNSTGLRNIYINGILKNNSGPNKTSTPHGIPDSVTLFGQNFAGYVSDYREYATALSADDIMALYKNAGYVDSDGNVYAYEMTE